MDDIDDNYLYGQLANAGPEDNPERHLFAKVFDDDVKKAIEELPEDFRMVVVLSFLEGFSYQEIADILDVSVNTIKTRVFYAKDAMRKAMDEMGVTKNDI